MDKGKEKKSVIQDEEIFLYKPYTISSKPERPKTSTSVFITNKINNLKMVLISGMIHTRRQKHIRLTQEYIECRNFM